jgi:hypothetical protein
VCPTQQLRLLAPRQQLQRQLLMLVSLQQQDHAPYGILLACLGALSPCVWDAHCAATAVAAADVLWQPWQAKLCCGHGTC